MVNEQRDCDAEVLVIDAEPSVAVEEVVKGWKVVQILKGIKECPLKGSLMIFLGLNWHRPC